MLHILRPDHAQLIPGQLFAVEIYFYPDRPPRLCVDYVRDVGDDWASFRGTRLKPLTRAGLQRLIREAKRNES